MGDGAPARPSWLASVLAAYRASSRFGAGVKANERGDDEAALLGFRDALTLLEAPRVDPDALLVRSVAIEALYGYARAAVKLGRRIEVLKRLDVWRPRYLEWGNAPVNRREEEIYAWLEAHFPAPVRCAFKARPD